MNADLQMKLDLHNIPNCKAIDDHLAEIIHGGMIGYHSENSTGQTISRGFERSNKLEGILTADTARGTFGSSTFNARFLVEFTEVDGRGRLGARIGEPRVLNQQGGEDVVITPGDFPNVPIGRRPVGVIIRELGPAPGGQTPDQCRTGFRSSGSCPSSYSIYVS